MRVSPKQLYLPCAARISKPRTTPEFGPGLFDYSGGRFLFNERTRLRERHVDFNAHALARSLCLAVGRTLPDLLSVKRFAEGGFNRILKATFSDGLEILARLPFKLEAPLHHSVASEAATLTFLRLHGIPVPKVHAYSSCAANPVGTEYLLLEKIKGTPLGEKWYSLDNRTLAKIMKQIVEIEGRLMSLPLPASGSLYFAKDLPKAQKVVALPQPDSKQDRIVVGPAASYAWWYRERASMEVDRGPWLDFRTCFEASARRELAFCERHAEPRLHVERYLRELQDFKPQSPAHHADLLSDYLQLAPLLNIPPENRFSRPTIRHPDLSPSNILLNDENEIVGIIDWQHTIILPLCLCAGIPKHYQNWGDPVSESLQRPDTKLPPDFDSLDESSQAAVRETFRRRLVHFFYGALTLKRTEDHFDALRDEHLMLRAKLYDRAAVPWEGNSLGLEHTIIQVQDKWPLRLEGSTESKKHRACPLTYTRARMELCLEKAKQEDESLQELEEMRDVIGIDALGWVPDDEHLAKARVMRDTIKAGLLRECATEDERIAIREHFPFDDHDE